MLVVNHTDLQKPLHPALSISAQEQKGAALWLSQLGSAEGSLQGWRFAAGRSLATGTGQVGCQTFPPTARGGWILPQVVFVFLSSLANSLKSVLKTQTSWKHLMLQVSPGVGRGRTSAVTARARGHLLTLLDVWIYTNLREAESFKGYVPGVYREGKKYFSQAADFRCIN